MQQKVITSGNASALNHEIAKMIEDGWKPLGPHRVVEVLHQLQYSGSEHKRTLIEVEYSQTMVKED